MSSLCNYYCSILKQCRETLNLKLVKKLHCLIITTQKYPDTFLSSSLISTYSDLGNLGYARHVFDKMSQPNTFSWNIILSAYSKTGRILEMQEVFESIPIQDGISWNVFISGYVRSKRFDEAVNAYRTMLEEGTGSLSRITFSTMLLLSSEMDCVNLGKQLHGQIVKLGFFSYMFVANPLLDMYSKLGFVSDAKQVFDESSEKDLVMYNTMISGFLRCGMFEDSWILLCSMPERDSITWTSMITGLTQNGLDREAVLLMREMRLEGFDMDQFTFGSVLAACGRMGALKEGTQLHAFIIKTGYDNYVFAGNSLIVMYSKCSSIQCAEKVFNKMTDRSTDSWTTMLVGYSQNGLSEKAIKLFCQIQKNSIKPNDFTLGSAISSCAVLASLEEGAQFHCQALVSGLISSTSVSNSLITLYGRCGIIEDSLKIFKEMKLRDGISWTALISGYAQFGKANETIRLFEEMLSDGLKPDDVTFVGVLSACSRAGLVEKGKLYFESMVKEHGIDATPDHYTCMIDLFSRAGKLEEAKDFISQMPFIPDASSWCTLLSSCRIYGNKEIGKWAADSLLKLDPQHPAGYILLCSIYAAEGEWDRVAQLRKGMRDNGISKNTGYSSIKYNKVVHMPRPRAARA